MRVLFYWIVAFAFRLMMKIYNRVTVTGLEGALTAKPPVIIAANHCSNLDPIVVGAFFTRRLRYLAKSELFSFLPLGLAIRALGAVPTNREDLRGSAGAVKYLVERLQAGENILLFPEGQRCFDVRLQPLDQGVGLLAVRTGAPVIPAYIHGTFEAMPRGSRGCRPVKISLSFGQPLYPASLGAKEASVKELRRDITDHLEASLKELEAVYF